MGRLAGKNAIVTGAAQGIGKAIAKRFAAEGARVLIADRNQSEADRLAQELGQKSCCVDVSIKTEVQSMVDTAISAWGQVDILVNNAGIFNPVPLLELDEQDFDRVLAVNLKSVLFGIQAVAPGMIARRSGAIVNLASVVAVLGTPGTASYGVSKAGIVQLTNVAAIELAPYGVRVNAIGPGTIETEMAQSAYDNPEIRRTMLSRTPLGRAGDVSEIAGVALFLASDDSTYVTGKTIFADGGRLGLNLTVPVE